MRGMWHAWLALTLLLAMAGCSAKRPPKASVPASAAPGVSSLPAQVEADSKEGASATQDAEETVSSYERVVVPPLHPAVPEEQETGGEDPNFEPPTVAKPRPPKRPAAATSVRTPEPEAPVEPDPAKANDLRAPALKPMLSEAERRQLDGQITGNLDRARKNFTLIREDRLGTNERSVLEEARSFAVRADQLRRNDPALANSLAERAAILTQELLRKQ
ncbi:MAG: hypothetical protein IT169_11080 [Bryobacterales bacterium]|nr:hypothetical protein [Bryobacterales bacterium]